jgi:DnaJ-class molecular chaperone
MVALGLLLEDYLNEGSSHRAWTGFRQEVSNSALELDKLISKINNSQNTRFNKDSRQKLAKTLFKLRNFLVLENQTDSNYSTDLKVKFVNAEKEFSQKLLDNLRDDKCVVCYTNLNNSKGQLLACPQCGHGGHKDHLEEWFKNKTSCPACKSDLSTSQFLLLS